jgi:hypothetical protein
MISRPRVLILVVKQQVMLSVLNKHVTQVYKILLSSQGTDLCVQS